MSHTVTIAISITITAGNLFGFWTRAGQAETVGPAGGEADTDRPASRGRGAAPATVGPAAGMAAVGPAEGEADTNRPSSRGRGVVDNDIGIDVVSDAGPDGDGVINLAEEYLGDDVSGAVDQLAEGRPPQLAVAAELLPNPGQQRWTRVRKRLERWSQTCEDRNCLRCQEKEFTRIILNFD